MSTLGGFVGFSSGGTGGGGGGTVMGSGTLNYVSKWTPNGTTLGNSQIFDNGTSIGVATNTPNSGSLLDVRGVILGLVGGYTSTLVPVALAAAHFQNRLQSNSSPKGVVNSIQPYGLTADSSGVYTGMLGLAYWDGDATYNLTNGESSLIGVSGTVLLAGTSGSVGNVICGKFEYQNLAPGLTVDNVYGVVSGLKTNASHLGTTNNFYAYYTPDMSAVVGAPNKRYGIYIDDPVDNYMSGGYSVGALRPTSTLAYIKSASGTAFRVDGSLLNNILTVTNSGFVGVNTSNPLYELYTNGTAYSNRLYVNGTNGVFPANYFAGIINTDNHLYGLGIWSLSNNYNGLLFSIPSGNRADITTNQVIPMSFSMNGTEVMRIDGNYRLGIGTTTAAATLSVKSSSGTAFRVDGSLLNNILYVENGGGVGINTDTPAGKLDVNGRIYAREKIYMETLTSIYFAYDAVVVGNGVRTFSRGELGIAYNVFEVNTPNEITTSGAKLASINNNSVEKFSIDKDGNALAAGTIKTLEPSATGAGAWKLGKKITAIVALVTTDYIEVDIDGTVYKLGLVN